MVAGDPGSLDVMVTKAVTRPVAVGAKCPWIVQLAPIARLAPQLLPKTNEDAFVPVTAMPLTVKGELPTLVIVTCSDTLDVPTVVAANARLLGERVIEEVTPVPLSAIVCGEVVSLSVMVTIAVMGPVAVGWKCPWITQLAPTVRVAPHVLLKTN